MMLFYSEKYVKSHLYDLIHDESCHNWKEISISLDSLAGGSKELETYYLDLNRNFSVIELRLGMETIATVPVVNVKDELEVSKVTIQILEYLKSMPTNN